MLNALPGRVEASETALNKQPPMEICYLALAHNNPGVLGRAVKALASEHSPVYIHVDRKSDLAKFSGIEGEHAHFSERRLAVHWGEFSIVEATLLLLRWALERSPNAEYFVLLSGSSTYRLRSSDSIRHYLERNRGQEFISLAKVPAPGKPLSRINTVRFPSRQPVRRFLARASAKLGMGQRDYRKYLGNMDAYAGNTWWALTRGACEYMLDLIEKNPAWMRFFENVFTPDESIFHTILGNSHFKPRIRRNLLYEDWSAQGAHPAMINAGHVALFQQEQEIGADDGYGSGVMLFTRKLCDGDIGLLDRIDEMIERKEKAAKTTEREERTTLQEEPVSAQR
ncbi:MAG TPA: beta-1,6-N-acetylglucosaminyltransferase [Candidatus Sulfotelmatobacter sp.]